MTTRIQAQTTTATSCRPKNGAVLEAINPPDASVPQMHALLPLRFRFRAIVPMLVIVAALGLGACSRQSDSTNKEPVSIGMEATAVNSLIYIAEKMNYFAANGIDITIEDEFPSGAAAAERMLKGDIDIATTAEFPIVRYAFERRSIQIVASIDTFTHMKLLGRRDRGINSVPDLENARIGVPLKTAAEFSLGRFLDLHGIDRANITVVDVQAPQATDVLNAGTVDAVVTWQPQIKEMEDLLGDRLISFSIQSGQPIYCLLVTSGRWADDHPELLDKFIQAMLQAENYLVRDGKAARAIVQEALGYNDRFLDAIWLEHRFSTLLDQSLVLAMEDQARWMVENGLTDDSTIPNFLDYIHEKNLAEIRPYSVNIIR